MHNGHTAYLGKRESGISLIGDLPWGSHFCQFYQTREDLLETLVPYFRAGLTNNELCVLVTDDSDANRLLRQAMPQFEEWVRKGQAEVISRSQWLVGDAEFASTVVARLDKAVSKGFDGLRLAYNVVPEQEHGGDSHDTADAIGGYNVIALFAYPRHKFNAVGLLGVVKTHHRALVKNAGRWEIIESSEARTVKDALRSSEEKLRSVFVNMLEGFAYHRVILDAGGTPCDYVFLEVNEAFERLTGLRAEDLIGRRATETLPGIKNDPTDFIGRCGKVALTGEPARFESYLQAVQRWYSVSAFSPHRGFFAVTFSDITERKAAEAAMQDANERLQDQAEKLQAQAEELRAANEELRNSGQALREAHERVASVARFPDENPNPVVRASADGTVLYRNPAAARLPGWTCELGRPLPALLLPLVAQAMAEGRVVQPDVPLGERFYSVAVAPLVREGYANLYGRDVTEPKQAEEQLRASEHRLRLALEGGQMGRWEWDLGNDVSFWSERVYELLGLEASTPATSRVFFARVDPQDRGGLHDLIRRTATDGGDIQAEFRVSHTNGELAWLALRGRLTREDGNQTARLFAVLYDITSRKQMEADLRRLNDQLEQEVQTRTEELRSMVERLEKEIRRRVEAEKQLRRRSRMLEGFFGHTITPLAFMDRDFNFVRVNEAYAKADGKTPEYFVGRNHFDLYPHEENRAIFEQVVRTKKTFIAHAKPFRYAYAPERGTSYWHWQLTPLFDDSGEVQFLVLNLEDVTEQQVALQQLAHRARQLQQLTLELSQAEDRERKRLAEILHDDLQQHLAAAKFQLSLLGSRVTTDTNVQKMVGQLDQILKDAIEKSRSLSHELYPAILHQSGLGDTFEWLADQMQTKHGLTVNVEVLADVHPGPEALKTFLYKAAQEILFNVVKHAKVREARLRLQRVGNDLWLTIADRGRGFDPRTIEEAKGLGLLSLRERIELLGGRMRIRSAEGKGSVFLIVLPDSDVPGPPQNAPMHSAGEGIGHPDGAAARAQGADGRRLRILLVDDHKVVREGLAILLGELPDMEIVGEAGNGREAVDLAYKLKPDVVVMDVAMPVVPGDEATRQIKLHVPQARVIALSMFEETEKAEAMRQAGAEIYLLKTAPSDELIAAIRGGW